MKCDFPEMEMHIDGFVPLPLLQYLNRGCTRFFATRDTDQQILQNRKSSEVNLLWLQTDQR